MRRLPTRQAAMLTFCVADNWEPFADVYTEADVMDERIAASDRIDNSIIEWLGAEGYDKEYSSNKWIGRVGP